MLNGGIRIAGVIRSANAGAKSALVKHIRAYQCFVAMSAVQSTLNSTQKARPADLYFAPVQDPNFEFWPAGKQIWRTQIAEMARYGSISHRIGREAFWT